MGRPPHQPRRPKVQVSDEVGGIAGPLIFAAIILYFFSYF